MPSPYEPEGPQGLGNQTLAGRHLRVKTQVPTGGPGAKCRRNRSHAARIPSAARLSHVREAYDRGLSTKDAVEHGIISTAGVVTSAALVMVGVFFVFALMPVLDMKEMGVGLAVAVLIDATIIRAVLLPASMTLLGDANWYLPKWLEWLPRLEPPVAPHKPAERVEAPPVPVA
jgi:hypothetical protein